MFAFYFNRLSFFRTYRKKKFPFSRHLTVLTLFLVFFSQSFSQISQSDYTFLLKLNNTEIMDWANKSTAKERVNACNYLLKSGKKHFQQRNFAKAKTSFEIISIFSVFSETNKIVAESYFENGRAIIELEGNKGFGNALINFTKAQNELKKISDPETKSILAKVLLEIADIKIKTVFDDSFPVLDYINESFQLAEQLKSEELKGLVFKSLGLYYFYKENYAEAFACYEQAETYLAKSNDYNSLLEIQSYLVYVFNNQNKFDLSFYFQQKGEKLLSKNTSRTNEYFFIAASIAIYSNAGNDFEAIRLARIGIKKAQEIGNKNRELFYVSIIGLTYLWEKEFSLAEKELKNTLSLAEELDNAEYKYTGLLGLAEVAVYQNNSEEARKIFRQIEIDKEKLIDQLKYRYYLGYGMFLATQLETKKAQESFDMAMRYAEKSNFTPAIFNLNYLKTLYGYQAKEISADEAVKKLDEVILQFKDLLYQTQNLQIQANNLDDKIAPFRFKTQLEIERDNFAGALLHTDSYKSRWLSNKLNENKQLGDLGTSWILTDEAKAIRKNLFQKLLELMQRKGNQTEITALVKGYEEKANAKRDIEEIKKKVAQNEITQAEIQSLTQKFPNSAILSYSFTTDGVVVFVLKQNEPIKAFRINIAEKLLNEKIGKWRDKITKQDLGVNSASRELYDLLIKPIENEINSKNQLIIIPDGILWKVPFQALKDSQQKYLIQTFSVSYVPSLKILQTLKNRENSVSAKSKNIAGFGNPTTDLAKPLLQAENEIKSLAQIYPNGIYKLKENATETNLKSEIGKVDLLHLAVHGKLDESQPMRSAMLLTKDKQNDGKLEVEEIIELEKSPKLVILSACSTSNGQTLNGEGLLSLSWAFLAAGSQNVIGTQWDIDDKATAEQMNLFHQNFAKGEPTAKALQNTAIKQIEKKGLASHPFYWAGFVTVGVL